MMTSSSFFQLGGTAAPKQEPETSAAPKQTPETSAAPPKSIETTAVPMVDKNYQPLKAGEGVRVNLKNTIPVQKKYVSTKEYRQGFPVAYRQWRADSHCNQIHGYALSFKFYFETDDLDVRNWAMDYGGLKPLKEFLENYFDHTLLVAEDDPAYTTFMELQEKGLAKVITVSKTGCEGLADYLYEYVNTIFLPQYGKAEAERLWCCRVEVRETDSNMAYREGHREWNEF